MAITFAVSIDAAEAAASPHPPVEYPGTPNPSPPTEAIIPQHSP